MREGKAMQEGKKLTLQRFEEIVFGLEEGLKQAGGTKDSRCQIPIVGEFSSGKTRLLRELFQGRVPEELLPISSIERQTFAPLEITYGEEVGLWEGERDGASFREKKKLSSFPQRSDVKDSEDPKRRFCLRLPETRLVFRRDPLEEAGSGGRPTRISLIDTRGWNSGEADASRRDLPKFGVLSVIYVIHAGRLQSRAEMSELEAFLAAFCAACGNNPKLCLHVYMTNCPKGSLSEEVIEGFRTRIKELVLDQGIEEEQFLCTLTRIDFGNLSSAERMAFQKGFWEDLQKGWEGFWGGVSEKCATVALPPALLEGLIPESLRSTVGEIIERWGKLEAFGRGIEERQKEGKWFPEWNATRLKGHKGKERGKLWLSLKEILKILPGERFPEEEELSKALDAAFQKLPSFPAETLFRAWREEIFLPPLSRFLDHAKRVIRTFFGAIRDLASEEFTGGSFESKVREKVEPAVCEFLQEKARIALFFPSALLSAWDEKRPLYFIVVTWLYLSFLSLHTSGVEEPR